MSRNGPTTGADANKFIEALKEKAQELKKALEEKNRV